MKVLALVPSQKGHSPGQRGSVELWEAPLHDAGIKLDYAPFETDRLRSILYSSGKHFSKAAEMMRAYANRLGLLRNLDEYDAVFVYREAALLGPAFLERRIAQRKPIIYQLDDPLFIPYKSPSNGLFSYFKFFGKVKEIIAMSKVVMVNSTKIREYAEQFNANIWQVPSVVDTRRFKFEQQPSTKRVCVGWSGSPTTLRNIMMIERPLQEISNADICDLHFIGGEDFGLKGVRYSAQKWNGETEVEDLRKMQVGLVPLPADNPWNPYKFIMKTAQYMALGIVPVGTPMASNPEVIRHGENGFLAENEADWKEYISALVADEGLRHKLSAAASEDAQANYSLEANAAKIVAAFRSAVE